jgi:hypothetical protein
VYGNNVRHSDICWAHECHLNGVRATAIGSRAVSTEFLNCHEYCGSYFWCCNITRVTICCALTGVWTSRPWNTAYCHYCLCSTHHLAGTLLDFGLEWMSLPPPHISASRGWQLSLVDAIIRLVCPLISLLGSILTGRCSSSTSQLCIHQICGSLGVGTIVSTALGHIICMVPDSSSPIRVIHVKLLPNNMLSALYLFILRALMVIVVDYPFSPLIMYSGNVLEPVRFIDPSAQVSSNVCRMPTYRYLSTVTFWYLQL